MMSERAGWIGVDLDGTLAEYHGWNAAPSSNGGIGAPIHEMASRVRMWIDEGKDVRIFTARVAPVNSPAMMVNQARQYGWILAWCEEHLGAALPITCQKDMAMIELWDDRVVQVEKNTGTVIGLSAPQEVYHV